MSNSLRFPSLSLRAVLGVSTVLVVLAAGAGCKEKPSTQRLVFGEIAATENLDFAPYLAAARAVLTHAPVPQAPADNRPGQRAFVTVWSPGNAPMVGTGIADTLFGSVTAAAGAIKQALPPDARIQLDFVSSAEPFQLTKDATEPLTELGLRGYVAVGTHGVGFVLPTEVVALTYFDTRTMATGLPLLAVDRLAETMVARAGIDRAALDDLPLFRIRTTSRIESDEGVTPIFRAMPPRPAALTPAELVDAVRAGADYLAGAVDDVGRFRYAYRPVADKAKRSYDWPRHAGAIYAMLEAYQELGDPAYLAKAEQALVFLDGAFQKAPDGIFLTDNPREEQQKVGGSGLALIALAKHAEVTRKTVSLEKMRALARFIAHQQYPDGHFRDNEDVVRENGAPEGAPLPKEPVYYAGEAILGLMRLYRLDRQPNLLEAAKKGADFVVFKRDASADETNQVHDHWMSYAMLDLYRETKVEAYAEHAFKIARSIVTREASGDHPPAPDFAGTFYFQGHTTPSSTRLEALAADLELSLYMGKDHAWLDGTAMRLACFVRAQQFDKRNSYFLKAPAKALGGVRESLLVNDIRIDYVQHSMSAWLHLARVLRDPNFAAPAGAPMNMNSLFTTRPE